MGRKLKIKRGCAGFETFEAAVYAEDGTACDEQLASGSQVGEFLCVEGSPWQSSGKQPVRAEARGGRLRTDGEVSTQRRNVAAQ